MRKYFFLTLLNSLLLVTAFSQDDAPKPPTKNASNVFGELGGNGLFFSANYDFRFSKTQKGLGMRMGLGFFGGSDGGILTVPVAINNLSGRAPHYLEIGLGYTYASFTSSDDFFDGASGGVLVPSIGYRYMPLGKGFTGRVVLSPLINVSGGGGWLMFGGISGGYKF